MLRVPPAGRAGGVGGGAGGSGGAARGTAPAGRGVRVRRPRDEATGPSRAPAQPAMVAPRARTVKRHSLRIIRAAVVRTWAHSRRRRDPKSRGPSSCTWKGHCPLGWGAIVAGLRWTAPGPAQDRPAPPRGPPRRSKRGGNRTPGVAHTSITSTAHTATPRKPASGGPRSHGSGPLFLRIQVMSDMDDEGPAVAGKGRGRGKRGRGGSPDEDWEDEDYVDSEEDEGRKRSKKRSAGGRGRGGKAVRSARGGGPALRCAVAFAHRTLRPPPAGAPGMPPYGAQCAPLRLLAPACSCWSVPRPSPP